MRKAIALSTLLLALFAFGCAGMQHGDEAVSKKTMIKCPKCGAEFTVGEGLGGGKGP